MFRFYAYNIHSESLRNIIPKLNKPALRVYPDRGYRPRPRHIVINWGNTQAPAWGGEHIQLNKCKNVQIAVDKRLTFRAFKHHNVSHPDWTEDYNEAIAWINRGDTVLCRRTVHGHGGDGIVVATTVGELVDSPLYVKYKKKLKEFRVHVFKGQVIDLTEKRKRNHRENINTQIRSAANGWVFCHQDIVVPDGLLEESIKAVAALGLDFGGVDIIWNQHENKCYILEVNTAPGVEETTAVAYATAFNAL